MSNNCFLNTEFAGLLENFKKIIKKNKLKYTKQREALLESLYYNHNNRHLTPEEIFFDAKKRYPELNIGIATVYRTLNLLEDAAMVTSISFGTQGKKYELALKPHHEHLICKDCGKIVEFEDEIIEDRQKEIAKKHKFKLASHILQLYGLCEDCQKKVKD